MQAAAEDASRACPEGTDFLAVAAGSRMLDTLAASTRASIMNAACLAVQLNLDPRWLTQSAPGARNRPYAYQANCPPTADGPEALIACRRNLADMERVLRTNGDGAFATIQAFYPLLKVRLCGSFDTYCIPESLR